MLLHTNCIYTYSKPERKMTQGFFEQRNMIKAENVWMQDLFVLYYALSYSVEKAFK